MGEQLLPESPRKSKREKGYITIDIYMCKEIIDDNNKSLSVIALAFTIDFGVWTTTIQQQYTIPKKNFSL